MIDPPQFDTLADMETSQWLHDIKLHMEQETWPHECNRCQETESINKTSIRLNAIEFDKQQTQPDYFIVGGVLDNICNSGCITCNESLSTKIGSLKSKTFPIFNNIDKFWKLPLHRVVHLDINGGEPSASKNYKEILQNLPLSIKSVRINTNCSIIIEEIKDLINRDIKVTLTVSLDGIDKVHDFVRWPIKWSHFYKNLLYYKNIDKLDINTWTTVSALNIHNFIKIKQFANKQKLDHSYAFLHSPDPINVKYENSLTLPYKSLFPDLVAIDRNNQLELDNFIKEQKDLRNIT
jgi:sulfatase maturation enzyme AslB (radical SAM superfamily)